MPCYEAEWMRDVTGGQWTRMPSGSLDSISNDTRQLSPGALYVALRGERLDGHAFVGSAFEAGAAAAMVERGRGPATLDPALPLLVVDDTGAALSALGAAHRLRTTPLVVGVTGSVGKSTVKEMTASVLAEAGLTARTRGNWNNEIGLPLSLLSIEPGSRYGVFEIGMNHPGEIARLCRVLQPEWGIVTTVGPVHLEYFESVQAIAVEKGALLQALPDSGLAFLCCDDAWFGLLRAMAPCPVRTVSVGGVADLTVHPLPAVRRLEVNERATGDRHSFAWPWAGRHNALNAGFALLAGREAGLSWEQLERGLSAYRPLPMRWQEVRVGEWLVINDAYNANPSSMRAAVTTFAQMPCQGRRWMVLGDMLELGAGAMAAHEALGGEAATAGEWAGLLTVGPLAEGIADGALACGFASERLWKCADTQTAAAVLREQLGPGDAVLLKASRGVALETLIKELDSNNRRSHECVGGTA